MRELREDPFERMRQVPKNNQTPLGPSAERISAFELSPHSVVDLWFERMIANGMRQLRISDPANDAAGWQKSVARAKRRPTTILNQIYSVSPKPPKILRPQSARSRRPQTDLSVSKIRAAAHSERTAS